MAENTQQPTEEQNSRLEELSPIVKEVLDVVGNDKFEDYKIVDIVEALSLSSGVLVTTSMEEDAIMRSETEGEQLFNYLMKGLRTYVDKQDILHGSVLLGVIKTLGFLSNFIATEDLKRESEVESNE